jgi:hypothetical protein
MNDRNPRPAQTLAQRDAAARLGRNALPDPLRLSDAAFLLAAGDTPAGFRWVRILRAAVGAGELPAVVEHVKGPPPRVRVPAGVCLPGEPVTHAIELPPAPVTIRSVALADLRAWLVAISAPVPAWLPGDASNLDTPEQPEPVDSGAMPECEPETPRGRRQRWDRLAVAMDTARRAFHERAGHWPTARQLWVTLKHKDSTGAVIDASDERLTWLDEAGGCQATDFRAFEKRLARLKAKAQRGG